MRSVRNFFRQRNKAFTLWELTITMGLFLLVAGLVISFIVFMSKFSDNNSLQSERVSQLTDIRREVDYWFSYYDSDKYKITLGEPVDDINAEESGVVILAYAEEVFQDGSLGTVQYVMRLELIPDAESDDIFTHMLVCMYPASAYHGEISVVTQNNAEIELCVNQVSCSRIYSVKLYDYDSGWSYEEERAFSLRFLINLHVTDKEYACVISYG